MTSSLQESSTPVSAVQPRLELSTAHQGSRAVRALPEVQIAQRLSLGTPPRQQCRTSGQQQVAAASRCGSSIARRQRIDASRGAHGARRMPQELQTLFATLGAYFALLFRALARFVGEPGAVESEGEFELLALAAQRIEQAEAEADYPLGWTIEE